MSELVRLEREGELAVVTIDHPPANAISRAVIAALREAMERIDTDVAVRCAILTAAGTRFFAAGADVSEFEAAGGETIADGQALTQEMEGCRVPLVAAVNGMALGGGCELALACDVRIASRSASFGQPEINLGIIPGWGGTQRLPRILGRTHAMTMLLTGEPVDAETALLLGLVSQVVEPEALLDTARAFAAKVAGKAPLAVAATKRAVVQGLDRSLDDGLAAERREFVGLFGSEDAAEGIAAFLGKRRPTWTGR